MIPSSIFLLSLFLVRAYALPLFSLATVHEASIKVVQDTVNNKKGWQVQVNGSDATIAELHETIADNARRDKEARRVGKDCWWHDGVGPLDCSEWSFTLGVQGSIMKRGNLTVYGQHWKINFGAICRGSPNRWISLTSPLPWTIEFHGGNACKEKMATGQYEFWDNCWIKYASEFINMPTDTRCGTIWGTDGRRCILPRHDRHVTRRNGV